MPEAWHERAGWTTRHGCLGTAKMQTWHGTDKTGTALRPGTAGTARHGTARHGRHGTAWHGRAWPGLADARAKGRETFGMHNQPIPKAPGPANMAHASTAQHGAHWHGYGEFLRKARHGWHGTAGRARLAWHDAYTWHGRHDNLSTNCHFGPARHGTARGHPGIHDHPIIHPTNGPSDRPFHRPTIQPTA